MGGIGSLRYFKDHQQWKNESFVFVSETDVGAFRPTSPNAIMITVASNPALVRLQGMAQLIRGHGIPIRIVNFSIPDIGDIGPAMKQGIPGIWYINRDRTWDEYTFVHSQGDTMTVLKPEDIDYTGAMYAAFANIIANLDTNLQLKNMTMSSK